MKACGRCKEIKDLSEFHRNSNSKDGCASDCKLCARARARQWNADNKDRANNKSREWQKANRERRKKYMDDYYARNRERLIAANSEWNRNNPDLHREAQAAWRRKNKEDRITKLKEVLRTAQTNAKKRGFECEITLEVFDAWLKTQGEKCALTDIDFDYSCDDKYRVRPFAPSIDRIDSSKGYTFDNIQIVCVMVNRAKNEMTQELFDRMCLARAEVLNAGKTQTQGRVLAPRPTGLRGQYQQRFAA